MMDEMPPGVTPLQKAQAHINASVKMKELVMGGQRELMKGLILINGAAIVALLALVGQLFSTHENLALTLIIPTVMFATSMMYCLYGVVRVLQIFSAHANAYDAYGKAVANGSEAATLDLPPSPDLRRPSQIMALSFFGGICSVLIIFALYAIRVSWPWQWVVNLTG